MASPAPVRTPALPMPRASYAAAWAVLFAVYTALFVVASGVPVGMAAKGAFAAALPPAIVGIAALDLARRWPWPSAGRWRLGVRLVGALLGLDLLAIGLWLAIVEIDVRIWTTGRRPTAPIVLWQFVIDFLLLLSLAGFGYARYQAEALREAAERAARAEALRARAELQLLRSQVQPHFILNVLHALLGLVRRDPERAEKALERLGELLRFGSEVHQSDRDWVPLSREWEFVTSYLDLERIRLGDRLRVSIDADPAALDVPVPPFALQPLVENAITHGVAPRASGGRVAVAARRSDGRLRLSVTDDGPGASEAAIAASPRLGLRLLRERLAALYGDRARVRFDAPPGGGFSVLLELPDDGGGEGTPPRGLGRAKRGPGLEGREGTERA